MRILVDVGHPGHVHFYKNAIWNWQEEGHEVLISARDKDVTAALLDHYGFPYRILSKMGSGSFRSMVGEFIRREWALIRLIREFDPHVVTEVGGLFIAPVCKLMGNPSVVFTDSEPVPLDRFLTYPFATRIYTPDCFMRDLGPRHVRYAGYHELAYLHPRYFNPDPAIRSELGVGESEPYIILRFVAWKAGHDVAQRGFSPDFKRRLVRKLREYGRVFVTSESPLPAEFEPYRIAIAPHRIHHALHYASLFLGDGATMATEAAILGTPAVRASSMALNMGNFVELMDCYRLVFSYYDAERALAKAEELLATDAKGEWMARRERLLAEKIDVTSLVVKVTRRCGLTV